MVRRSKTILDGRPLVELRGVSKRFIMHREARRSFQETFINLLRPRREAPSTFWPIRDVSLVIHQGDSLGIIGPNGSGKSTLLKLISGILEPTAGDIFTAGRMASLLELGAGFHPELTGRENIYLNGSIYGLTRSQMRERVESIIDFAEIGDFIDVPVKHYSSGMYVRLGFAVAIHTEPDLLLVDEVLAVGDLAFQHKCLDSIQAFRDRGGTLLLVSHDLAAIQSICKRAIWVDRGRIRAEGGPTDVVMAYLSDVAERSEGKTPGEVLSQLEEGRRWGSGKVQITHVELCDEAGAVRRNFFSGDPMVIRMRYRAAGRVHEPIFGLAIHHQNGTHICGPNTRFGGLPIPLVEGEGIVSYTVPELPLLEGTYLVSVAVVDRTDTETYDYHDRAYLFRVSPGRSSERYGLVTLGGHWHIEPLPAPAVEPSVAGRGDL